MCTIGASFKDYKSVLGHVQCMIEYTFIDVIDLYTYSYDDEIQVDIIRLHKRQKYQLDHFSQFSAGGFLSKRLQNVTDDCENMRVLKKKKFGHV